MKALRRSLSPFRRRRNAQELIHDIQVKEGNHSMRNVAVRSSSLSSLIRYGEPKIPSASTTATATANSSTGNRGRTAARRWFRNKLTNVPTRDTSLERNRNVVDYLPVIRQVSLADTSVVDVTMKLRLMETQIRTAQRQGKQVSRAKVIGALLSVVDQLDAEQQQPLLSLQPKTNHATDKVTVIVRNQGNEGQYDEQSIDSLERSYQSSHCYSDLSMDTNDEKDEPPTRLQHKTKGFLPVSIVKKPKTEPKRKRFFGLAKPVSEPVSPASTKSVKFAEEPVVITKSSPKRPNTPQKERPTSTTSWFPSLMELDTPHLQQALADFFLIGSDPEVVDSKVVTPIPSSPGKKPSTTKRKSVAPKNETLCPCGSEGTPSVVASSLSNSPDRIVSPTKSTLDERGGPEVVPAKRGGVDVVPTKRGETKVVSTKWGGREVFSFKRRGPDDLPTKIVIDTSNLPSFMDSFNDEDAEFPLSEGEDDDWSNQREMYAVQNAARR